MRKIILVVQAPDADTSSPIPGVSGKHLAALAGVEYEKLGEAFERVNLLPEFQEKFKMKAAKPAAEALKPQLVGKIVLLVGKKVAEAFGLKKAEPFVEHTTDVSGAFVAAMIPHPSRLNLYWNAPANVETAKAYFVKLRARAESESEA